MYPAIIKYGEENFIIEQLDIATTLDELNQKEQYWIRELNTQDPEIGYNISAGGDGGALFLGHTHSDESKQKMSEHNQWNGSHSNRYGVTISDAQKQKISKTLVSYYSGEQGKQKAHIRSTKSWVTRRANSTTHTTNGMHIYNNGIDEIRATRCPSGYVEGPLLTDKKLQMYEKLHIANREKYLDRFNQKINSIDKDNFINDYVNLGMGRTRLCKKYSLTQNQYIDYIKYLGISRKTYKRPDTSLRNKINESKIKK